MGVKHSKIKNKAKQLNENNGAVEHVSNGNGTMATATTTTGDESETAPQAFKREKKRSSFFRFRLRRRNSFKEIKNKSKKDKEEKATKLAAGDDNVDDGGEGDKDDDEDVPTERIELDNDQLDKLHLEEKSLKGAKEKSKSISNFQRASSLRGSSMKAINSIMNLHRSNSLRSLLGRERRNKRRQQLDAEQEDLDTGECHFEKLYEQDLHLKVFEYFSLAEKVQLRAVCYRWDKDLFREQRYLRYPLFKAHSVPANNRQAKLLSKKYLYYCFHLEALKINQELTRVLFLDLLKCLHRSHLRELIFNVADKQKNEVIQCNLYGNFCRDFASQVKTLSFVMDRDQAAPSLKHADFSLNDTTDFILLMTILHDNLFTSLVNFELILSTKLTANYFRKFIRFYQAKLQTLTVRFCFKIDEFVELTKTILEDLKMFKQLQSLSIFLMPFASTETITGESVQIDNLLRIIATLSTSFAQLDCFKLFIDNQHVELAGLNVLKHVSSYRQVRHLATTVYGTIDQLDHLDFSFDFGSLRTLTKLKHFEFNCTKLSDADVERLAWAYPQLHSLTLGCDVRITNVSMNTIARLMGNLREVTITGHRCLNPYVQKVDTASKEHLFIDNDALRLFLEVILEKPASYLRSISLANCRIDPENDKLLAMLRDWASTDEHGWFAFRLAHNRFPLKLSHVFVETSSDYMRPNLKISFD